METAKDTSEEIELDRHDRADALETAVASDERKARIECRRGDREIDEPGSESASPKREPEVGDSRTESLRIREPLQPAEQFLEQSMLGGVLGSGHDLCNDGSA